MLAFTAVIREGIETSLFLVGQVDSAETDAPWVLVGAVVGLAIAILIGYGFYRGSRRVNLAAFFRWTGVGLVFIAAGLLSHAVHEFIEMGVITFGTQTVFDIGAVLPHGGERDRPFLRALFGYSREPRGDDAGRASGISSPCSPCTCGQFGARRRRCRRRASQPVQS